MYSCFSQLLDTDKSDSITLEELSAFIEAHVSSSLENNGDGKCALVNPDLKHVYDKPSLLFKECDKNGDGLLTMKDLELGCLSSTNGAVAYHVCELCHACGWVGPKNVQKAREDFFEKEKQRVKKEIAIRRSKSKVPGTWWKKWGIF